MTTMNQDFEWVDDPLHGDQDVEPVPLHEIPVFDAAPIGVRGEGDGWRWHDAGLIATERVTPDGEDEEFTVGLVDLYQHQDSGEIGGRYLELGRAPDLENMAALYHQIEDAIDDGPTLPFERADAAERWLSDQGTAAPDWRDASAVEIAAHDAFAQAARDITNDDTRPMPGIADSWETFVTDHTPGNPDPPPEPHLWQMHTRPVESPQGLPLRSTSRCPRCLRPSGEVGIGNV